MQASRWIPALAVVCALGALTSCSGDDEPDPAADGSPSASTSQQPVAEKERDCKVNVGVTGAVQVMWKGRGTSMTSSDGPAAVYTASDGANQISVYAAGEDFATSANVTVEGRTFTTPLGDETGLHVEPSGKEAAVDSDAAGVEADAVRITASFEC